MDLVLTASITAHLVTMIKNDAKLARFFAGQFLGGLDSQVVANYLLTEKLATELLTRRLVADPERTLRDLTALAEGKPVGRGGQQGTGTADRRPRTAPTKNSSQPQPKPVKKSSGRRRKPLTPAQAEQLRGRVRAFLTKKPWSGRKQLAAAVSFPSEAIYDRIMGELKTAGDIVQRGERSKTTYATRKGPKK